MTKTPETIVELAECTFRGYFADQISVFLLHAHELSRAAATLEIPRFGLSRSLLLGQSLELTLKAWNIARLHDTGTPISTAIESVRKTYGHDIGQLWRAAISLGLSLEEHMPHWVDLLSAAHGRPYPNRYPGCSDAFRVPSGAECMWVTQLAEHVSEKIGRHLEWGS
jgi:hypothetical protein